MAAPIWVNVNRAAKFPEVMAVYKRAGRGQGASQGSGSTTPKSAQRGFLAAVKRVVNEKNGASLPAWIRHPPGGSNDWQAVQVDVTAIPGVRQLNTNGKWFRFDQF